MELDKHARMDHEERGANRKDGLHATNQCEGGSDFIVVGDDVSHLETDDSLDYCLGAIQVAGDEQTQQDQGR